MLTRARLLPLLLLCSCGLADSGPTYDAEIVYDKLGPEMAGYEHWGGTRTGTIWVDPRAGFTQQTRAMAFGMARAMALEVNPAMPALVAQHSSGSNQCTLC